MRTERMFDSLRSGESSPAALGNAPLVVWHVGSAAQGGYPSARSRAQRERITALVCRALGDGDTEGRSTLARFTELTRAAPPVTGPALANRAAIFTGAHAMLRQVPAGEGWAVVHQEGGSRLEDPSGVTFLDPVDAVAVNDGGSWTFDVVSVALRANQIRYDLTAGRPRRCVELGAALVAAGSATSIAVRVFGPRSECPVLVATVEPSPLAVGSHGRTAVLARSA